MCGIVGTVSRSAPVDHEQLVRQRDSMSHRGPDDAGVWVSPDRRFGLAHRRLAIIDLSHQGRGPMRDCEGESKLWLAFNGEIYNYVELRARLRDHGHQFRTNTDSEVILKAYRQWGRDCVGQLRGMFAFAICDPSEGTILVARDRAGEKPLFYAAGDDGLVFASELKALLLLPQIRREVDLDALDEYLCYGYVSGDACMLAGLRKLPPAHALWYDVSSRALSVWRYWHTSAPEHLPVSSQPGELAEELRGLLVSAVGEQLVADVPVGILLSGGVDSSLLAALAARASRAPVRTFTIRFPGAGAFDEGPFARAVADHIGAEHRELPAQPATVDLLPFLAAQYDEPIADSSMVPTYLVSKLVREHATVALGGDGGDELFGGYNHFSWLQTQDLWRHRVPSPVRGVIGRVGRMLPPGVRGRNYVSSFADDTEGSLLRVNMYFDPEDRRRLCPWLPSKVAERRKAARIGAGGSLLRQATQLDFDTYLPDDILVKVDRASMLTSLEVRAPFLDVRVIEFAFGRISDQLRATGDERKVLLRAVARDLLPADFNLRRKQGFSLPLDDWFDGPWGQCFREVLTDPGCTFGRAAVDALLDGQARGRRNMHRLFALTFFELWRRHYGLSVPRS